MLQNIRHGFGSEAHKQHEIKRVSELSCHSKLVDNLFPEMNVTTNLIPEFILTEPCVGNCRIGKFCSEH